MSSPKDTDVALSKTDVKLVANRNQGTNKPPNPSRKRFKHDRASRKRSKRYLYNFIGIVHKSMLVCVVAFLGVALSTQNQCYQLSFYWEGILMTP